MPCATGTPTQGGGWGHSQPQPTPPPPTPLPGVLEHPELLQAAKEKTAPVGGEGIFLLVYHLILKTNATGLGGGCGSQPPSGMRLDVSPAPGHRGVTRAG